MHVILLVNVVSFQNKYFITPIGHFLKRTNPMQSTYQLTYNLLINKNKLNLYLLNLLKLLLKLIQP